MNAHTNYTALTFFFSATKTVMSLWMLFCRHLINYNGLKIWYCKNITTLNLI